MNQRVLLRRLADLQYTRNEAELRQGTFRVRGDILDVFPAESEREAVRVQLFDDEVEDIRYFDPLTGEMGRRVPRVTIYPKTHYVTPRETLEDAVGKIRMELRERLTTLRSEQRLVEAQRPGAANPVRYRNDDRSGLLHRNRELQPLSVRARGGRAPAVPVRLRAGQRAAVCR